MGGTRHRRLAHPCLSLVAHASAKNGEEDALNEKVLVGPDIFIVRVLRSKERLTVFNKVPFQSGFAINQGRDNFGMPGFSNFDHHIISIEDVGIDHGVSANSESKYFC